jgi:membrane protein involved in colicin uptake
MVFEFESAVAKQKDLDLAETVRVEEEGKRRAELVRQEAEHEAKAKSEKMRAIECSRKEIEEAERELADKKSALLAAEQVVGSGNDNDNDGAIQSATEDHVVSNRLVCIILHCQWTLSEQQKIEATD